MSTNQNRPIWPWLVASVLTATSLGIILWLKVSLADSLKYAVMLLTGGLIASLSITHNLNENNGGIKKPLSTIGKFVVAAIWACAVFSVILAVYSDEEKRTTDRNTAKSHIDEVNNLNAKIDSLDKLSTTLKYEVKNDTDIIRDDQDRLAAADARLQWQHEIAIKINQRTESERILSAQQMIADNERVREIETQGRETRRSVAMLDATVSGFERATHPIKDVSVSYVVVLPSTDPTSLALMKRMAQSRVSEITPSNPDYPAPNNYFFSSVISSCYIDFEIWHSLSDAVKFMHSGDPKHFPDIMFATTSSDPSRVGPPNQNAPDIIYFPKLHKVGLKYSGLIANSNYWYFASNGISTVPDLLKATVVSHRKVTHYATSEVETGSPKLEDYLHNCSVNYASFLVSGRSYAILPGAITHFRLYGENTSIFRFEDFSQLLFEHPEISNRPMTELLSSNIKISDIPTKLTVYSKRN